MESKNLFFCGSIGGDVEKNTPFKVGHTQGGPRKSSYKEGEITPLGVKQCQLLI